MCDELDCLWTAYREADSDLDWLDPDDTVATDTLEIKAMVFLALHHGHDIWAECDIGVLRLGPRDRPYKGTELPQRFRSWATFEAQPGLA